MHLYVFFFLNMWFAFAEMIDKYSINMRGSRERVQADADWLNHLFN